MATRPLSPSLVSQRKLLALRPFILECFVMVSVWPDAKSESSLEAKLIDVRAVIKNA